MILDKQCPGSSLVREPVPEVFQCDGCGAEVEIWTDETRRCCPGCGHTVYRDLAPSCIDWCRFAKQCIGTEAYRRLKGKDSTAGDQPAAKTP